MTNLYRHLAPSASAWQEIDVEARRTLKRLLAARRLVDFRAPFGYHDAGIGRGRIEAVKPPLAGMSAAVARMQPLVEHRVDFTLEREEIEAIDRGAKDPDLDPVIKAAQIAALSEDTVVFSGFDAADIRGIIELANAQAVKLIDDYEQFPMAVASALTSLRNQGIGGPYSLALGSRCYEGLTETSNQGGYPILNLVRQQIDGDIIWAPAIAGAVLISTRGGDFELHVGRDFAIGYAEHGATTVDLFLDISFTFSSIRQKQRCHCSTRKMAISRILVTGGTGFIGSPFTRRLLSRDVDVDVPTRDYPRPRCRNPRGARWLDARVRQAASSGGCASPL